MFRKPDPTLPSTPSRSATQGAAFSVIGADVVITGNIRSSAVLHLEGQVVGDIECAELIQGETGKIEGAIRAEIVRLAGRSEGVVETRALFVESTGRMTGEITYETLAIAEGGELQGQLASRGAAAEHVIDAEAAADDAEAAADDDQDVLKLEDAAVLEDEQNAAALEDTQETGS